MVTKVTLCEKFPNALPIENNQKKKKKKEAGIKTQAVQHRHPKEKRNLSRYTHKNYLKKQGNKLINLVSQKYIEPITEKKQPWVCLCVYQ